MPWVRFEENFPNHRKVVALSDGAFRMHVHAICHSNQLLTDGFIADTWLKEGVKRRLGNTADELVAAELWRRDEARKGYVIHDFLQYQPSKEKVEKERQQGRDRLQRFRDRAAAPKSETALPATEQRNGNAVSTAPVTPLVTPTRSDPIRSGTEEESVRVPLSTVDGSDVWRSVIEELQKAERVPEHSLFEWFRPCVLAGVYGPRIVIFAPTTTIGGWLTKHYREAIAEAIAIVSPGSRVEIRVRQLATR